MGPIPRQAPLPLIRTKKPEQRGERRVTLVKPAQTPGEIIPRIVGREFKGLGTAFLFSLTSVLNPGFQGFNFGQWMRMLQPRE